MPMIRVLPANGIAMEFVSKLTLRRDMEAAVHDLCVDVKSFKADLAFIFASHHSIKQRQDE